MIDFHTHTFFSDGELIPSELVRRAEEIGYEVIAITDHVDDSNYDFVVKRLVKVANRLNEVTNIKVIPGAEITHVPPAHIAKLAREIRMLGAKMIVMHGETLSEPVQKGTNLSAVQADIDLLAHPGLVNDETCEIAKERGILFEITSRKGHSLTNSHVANMALKYGIKMVINSDAHTSADLLTKDFANRVLLGASIPIEKIGEVLNNSREFVHKIT